MSDDNTAPSRRSGTISVPLRMPKELNRLVEKTAGEVKLSKQDTMRLGLERGLEVLKKQLVPEATPQATPQAAAA